MRECEGVKVKDGTKWNFARNFIRLSLDYKNDIGYWINNIRSKGNGLRGQCKVARPAIISFGGGQTRAMDTKTVGLKTRRVYSYTNMKSARRQIQVISKWRTSELSVYFWQCCVYKQPVNKTSDLRICVTLKDIRPTMLQWKSNKYYIFQVCVCSLSYPARKAHAPCYIVICGLSGYNSFFLHNPINGMNFRGENSYWK